VTYQGKSFPQEVNQEMIVKLDQTQQLLVVSKCARRDISIVPGVKMPTAAPTRSLLVGDTLACTGNLTRICKIKFKLKL
jgi:hypothetical protein